MNTHKCLIGKRSCSTSHVKQHGHVFSSGVLLLFFSFFFFLFKFSITHNDIIVRHDGIIIRRQLIDPQCGLSPGKICFDLIMHQLFATKATQGPIKDLQKIAGLKVVFLLWRCSFSACAGLSPEHMMLPVLVCFCHSMGMHSGSVRN